jgi:hypothetical protein
VSRALLLLLALLALPACSDASAGGFPWARRPSGGGGGGGGTPTVLQSNADYVSGTSTVTLAYTSSIAGTSSWLVVCANAYTVGETLTISDTLTSTWTQRSSLTDGVYGYIQCWTAPAGGSGSDTITLSFGAHNNQINTYIAEVSNVTTFDTHSEGSLSSGGYTTSLDWPSITPSTSTIVFACTGAGGLDNSAVTLQAGWTSVAITGHVSRLMMWKNVSAGALTPHIDIASANYGAGAAIALY